MPRERSQRREEAYQLWKQSGGNMKLKEIAERIGVSDSQVRKWKNQDKWEDRLNSNVTVPNSNVTKQRTRSKRNVPIPETAIPKNLQEKIRDVQPTVEEGRLTPKQRLFVQEYLKDLNATQAAIRAGYSEDTAAQIGYQLLHKSLVVNEIKRRQEQREKQLGIDAQWVLERLKLISDRCVQAEPVTDKDGNPIGEWRFDAAGANKATELIGKHLGMFAEKMKVEHSGEVKQVHEQHYYITQRIIEERPELVDVIFGRRMADRSRQGEPDGV